MNCDDFNKRVKNKSIQNWVHYLMNNIRCEMLS